MADLHQQLVKLGDMMGDGLHHEPDGKWIVREYNAVARALGYARPRANNAPLINERMAVRVSQVVCPQCGGGLAQTRSGSKRARCVSCSAKYQLLK